MWREADLLWRKTTKENPFQASELQKIMDQQRLQRLVQAAAAARNTPMQTIDGKLNCRLFTNADSPFKNEKIIEEEEEKSAKSSSSPPFSFARIRRMDDRRFVHHVVQDKNTTKNIIKSARTEDKFTAIEDFDDNSIDEERLAAVNARLRFPGNYHIISTYWLEKFVTVDSILKTTIRRKRLQISFILSSMSKDTKSFDVTFSFPIRRIKNLQRKKPLVKKFDYVFIQVRKLASLL